MIVSVMGKIIPRCLVEDIIEPDRTVIGGVDIKKDAAATALSVFIDIGDVEFRNPVVGIIIFRLVIVMIGDFVASNRFLEIAGDLNSEEIIKESLTVPSVQVILRGGGVEPVVIPPPVKPDEPFTRCLPGHQIHRTRNSVGILIGRQRLVEFYPCQRTLGNGAEVNTPVICPRRRDSHSINCDRGELGTESAQDHLRRLASAPQQRDSR